MIRILIVAATALAVLLPAPASAQETGKTGSLEEALAVVEIWLDAQKDYERLPGLSASIVHDQKLIWSGAVGVAEIEGARPAETNTLYSICSISKLFTSVAIMQLRDQGKLSLSDPISEHLGFFDLKQKYEDSTPITVESLLTHSGGLPREADFPYWSGPEFEFPTKEQVIEHLSEQETLYSSQTRYQYSNLGLSLLGYIVEEASDQPYDEYIREHILNPLGMNDTYPEMPSHHVGGQLAVGYGNITRNGERNPARFFEPEGIAPAAGFASTVEDLAKFAQWQFRLRGNREELLHGYTLAEMQRVHFATPGSTTMRGLGFSLSSRNGDTFVGHGGSCPGFRSQFSMQNEDKIGVAVAVNATVNAGKYLNGIYDLVKDPLLAEVKKAEEGKAEEEGRPEGGAEAAETKAEPEKPPVDFTKYLGTYTGGLGGDETVVVPWAGGIGTMGLPSDNPSVRPLEHVEGDTFRRPGREERPGSEVIFDTDADGRVIRMRTPLNYRNKVHPEGG
ncbi:MAG: beta-lactamase family protein [Gemmatimonadetes bacterium]|nr:beta-lactamase family protein [Gemmatimonadota bacterium]